ncbi:MAG: prepilin-type N-terminal cleavage/methylation domain-containing protein [Candidatus Omnitrophota bacterium]
MRKSNTKYQEGFSLIEVLVALFILGVGIAILFNLFPMGWQALAYSRKLNEVYLLAQRKLEGLKNEPIPQEGAQSAKEGDLSWSLSARPVKFEEGIEIIFVELDVDFEFQKQPQKQRFVAYITKE